MACKGCGKKASTRLVVPAAFRTEPLPDGEQMQVICVQPDITGSISLNSKAVRGKKYKFKTGTVLTLEIGDEWVQSHKWFRRHTPEVVPDVVELPKEPPAPPKLPFPVQGQVPVVAKRAEPAPTPEPAPQQDADPSVHNIGLSESLAQKLDQAGFKTKSALRADILKTAGASIKAIKGIGDVALVQIRQAVFG